MNPSRLLLRTKRYENDLARASRGVLPAVPVETRDAAARIKFPKDLTVPIPAMVHRLLGALGVGKLEALQEEIPYPLIREYEVIRQSKGAERYPNPLCGEPYRNPNRELGEKIAPILSLLLPGLEEKVREELPNPSLRICEECPLLKLDGREARKDPSISLL